jgi:ribosome maturation factor RimP
MADIAALNALIEPEAEALGLKIVRIAMFGGTSGSMQHDRNSL